MGKVDFYSPVRQKVELLREYGGGGYSAKLRLGLIPDCLDVSERSGGIIKVERMQFNRNPKNFLKTFSFIFYLVHLLETGDTGMFSCDREEMRKMIEGEADPILREAGIVRPSSDYNEVLKRLILSYDICGRGKMAENHGQGVLSAGYRLAGNLSASVVERPPYI
jgi:hypothetical protein